MVRKSPRGAKRPVRLVPEFDAREAKDVSRGCRLVLANASRLLGAPRMPTPLTRGEEDYVHPVTRGGVLSQGPPAADGLVIRMRTDDQYTPHRRVPLARRQAAMIVPLQACPKLDISSSTPTILDRAVA